MADQLLQSVTTSVLVVEDDTALRASLIAMLKRERFTIDCVNGAEALERLSEASYDVMLLDLMMSGSSGLDVLGRLARTQPWLLRSTILITGASGKDISKADSESVFAVMRKPVAIDQLVATILACTDQEDEAAQPDESVELSDSGQRSTSNSQFDASARRFELTLPLLRQLLSSVSTGHRDLMLRGELRRVAKRMATVFAAASAIQQTSSQSRRYLRLARDAAQLATFYSTSLHQH